MSEHAAEKDALRNQLRTDAEVSAQRPPHEKRYMPAIHEKGQLAPVYEGAALLRMAADALEAQPPKLRTQYVAALRLYADEPWRLTHPTPPGSTGEAGGQR
jgi:hypothetical protein